MAAILTEIVQGLVSGALVGGMYATVGIGLTLVFGVVRIVNFAHGSFVMAAAYCSWLLFDRFGLDPYVSGLFLVPGFFLIGVGYYWALMRPMIGKSLLAQSLITIAVSYVIENVALGLFTSQMRVVDVSYAVQSIAIGPISLPVTRLIAGVVGLGATALMYLLLWRTGTGIAVRAAAADRPIAEAMGINTHSAQAFVTGIGIACAALGGVVLLPIFAASPAMGSDFTFLSFLIIVLGGMGSFFGALVGGVILGVTENLGATFFDGSTGHMLTFVLFVILLVFRPYGVLVRRR
jgi:branched-chain amino acid transport system permease protein